MPKKFMAFDHDSTLINNSTEKSKILITFPDLPA